ncbi:MAG: hypothetical protein AMS24_00900 [Chlamydiae bacterium SM23_39]|nr:MAG: hypothetical protein AMS24_00900 [Chlamydiae bacterium SM23_39]
MNICTKIICTIGPATSSFKNIERLILGGMNVARLNFSHGSYKEHLEIINNIKKARDKLKRSVAIMLDTKGPEIRIKKVKSGSINVKRGEILKIKKSFLNEDDVIEIDPYEVIGSFKKNMKVLFNDGYILSKIIDKKDQIIFLKILNDGVLKNGNSVNIPDCHLKLPALTKKDKEDLAFGCKNDIDIVAASFIRSKEHLISIKKFLFDQRKSEVMVIAKIESKEGVDNFKDILKIADGIMVARGDLGVEVDLSLVPKYQKMMIRESNNNFIPVTIATQMLESMINFPRPTRAEVSDVANAIYDTASSLMLSAETSIGKYPVESVKQMRDIIKKTESDFDNLAFFEKESNIKNMDISTSMSIAAVKTSYSANAKAFFIYTSSGFTAKLISRWRPNKPIFALTTNKKIYNQLSIVWGVIPVYRERCNDAKEAFEIMSSFAVSKKMLSFGDLVVVTAGVPFGRKGSTNLMMLDSVGHILVRGIKGFGSSREGIVTILLSSKEKKVKNRIIVISNFDDSYIPLIRDSKGVIFQSSIADVELEKKVIKLAKKFNIPLIIRANNASSLLEEGQRVVLDTKKGLIYLKERKERGK